MDRWTRVNSCLMQGSSPALSKFLRHHVCFARMIRARTRAASIFVRFYPSDPVLCSGEVEVFVPLRYGYIHEHIGSFYDSPIMFVDLCAAEVDLFL